MSRKSSPSPSTIRASGMVSGALAWLAALLGGRPAPQPIPVRVSRLQDRPRR